MGKYFSEGVVPCIDTEDREYRRGDVFVWKNKRRTQDDIVAITQALDAVEIPEGCPIRKIKTETTDLGDCWKLHYTFE